MVLYGDSLGDFYGVLAEHFIAGGNYEFFSDTERRYPQHGSDDCVFIVDGPKGKRIQLYWPRQLRQKVAAAGTARLANLKELAAKHGWQDLRLHYRVELHGMTTESYNGKKGNITKDIGGGANGRWGVTLDGSEKPISTRARNLRVIE